MVRPPCYDNDDKVGMKKGPWTPEEDQKLLAYIQQHGHDESWRTLPPKAGLRRCGKSCRLRWTNYLRPDIKRGKFSLQEEQSIIQLHALLGNRWSAIATHLPKRTDNEIKNYWNTHLKKKLSKMGIDPITHKPKNHTLCSGQSQTKDFANLCHMAQWESARLEAEARFVQESKSLHNHHHSLNAAGAPPQPPPCLDVLQVWVRTNPGKDIINGFFTSNPNPNFSQNISYVEMTKVSSDGHPNVEYRQDEAKGIMGNSVEVHDIVNPIDQGFPNIMEGFADFPSNVVEACWNVLEDDDVCYWG